MKDKEFLADCIHLKACRRFNKLAFQAVHKNINRHCNYDCTCYESNDVFDQMCREETPYSEPKHETTHDTQPAQKPEELFAQFMTQFMNYAATHTH